ncbi:Acg family FMN-binding oxidoreductase [Amycolatopsis sp. H20-H5]|uniref:Acg family FMN-binding oxidoreductase n=1 Tax=Amycolatopsis sp. H20-H5 TaxID=3046309 RepID=UPI002DBE63DB|nr:nitroreductase family protein [Amycolatopsis sp. H20-H5]MEC3982233.1 nitroreductase family protein [Amycolatopsis sp. H20-H5]
MIITESRVRAAGLEAAVRAPSPYNTQPWIFELGPVGVDLYLDEDRVLAVVDTDGREARLACGAAILNFRLAVAAGGWASSADLLPDRTRPELLARLGIGQPRRPRAEEIKLAAAIARRFSNRRPFTEAPVPPHARNAVTAAARAEGANLLLLDEGGTLGTVASLVRRADTVQGEDPAYHRELAEWTSERGGGDGIPAFAGGPRSAGGLLPVRHHGPDSQPERPYERDPVIVALTTPSDGPLSQLRAGLALQRVLLTATELGLSASFLSQPIEIAGIRAELHQVLGAHEHPQSLLRLGYGYPGSPTPRRPLTAVTRRIPL